MMPGAADAKVLVHAACGRLLRLALELGPSAVDRARGVLWPDAPRTRRSR